uniref:SKP1 component dimerisation domain-containing protein n=1 Tax=Globodera rostochiensis TaxID=31243 RepID=A0A914H3B4_GLORO
MTPKIGFGEDFRPRPGVLYKKMLNAFSSPSSSFVLPSGSPCLSDELLKKEVQCECAGGKRVQVRVSLLLQSKAFADILKCLGLSPTDLPQDFVFPLKTIPMAVFRKIVDWMEHRVGKPEPLVEMDPITQAHKWFTLDEFEKNFFVIKVEELAALLHASNLLDIKSLFDYSCQSMASLLQSKNAGEIREMLGIEDDLTEEQKEKIRQKNIWYQY